LPQRVLPDGAFRILLAIDPEASAWQYSLDLARGLSALKIGSVIALIGRSATAEQRAAADRVPQLTLIETRPTGSAGGERSAYEVGAAIARLAWDYDVQLVQLNDPALATAADYPCPVVAVHRGCAPTRWAVLQGGDLPESFAWRAELVRKGLHGADVVVAPTSAHGGLVQLHYELPAPPRVVHIGRSPLQIPRAVPHDFVFTSGRLWDEGENLGLLDSAARRIGVPVRAAGPVAGPNGTEVVFDNLHCVGSLGESELGRWLATRPVFVSTALYESSGEGVLDAALAGCPLILSDIPAYRELWDDVAIFVDPNDEQGFVETITNLVGDDFERAVLGRAAKERAARYSPDVMAAQMASLYRGLLPPVLHPVLAARAA
jgi:glycosyltransferase involved in cell wall biosynthesis